MTLLPLSHRTLFAPLNPPRFSSLSLDNPLSESNTLPYLSSPIRSTLHSASFAPPLCIVRAASLRCSMLPALLPTSFPLYIAYCKFLQPCSQSSTLLPSSAVHPFSMFAPGELRFRFHVQFIFFHLEFLGNYRISPNLPRFKIILLVKLGN
jgi:hypothetical protein